MGCGSSINQVSDMNFHTHSSKPFRIEEVFKNQQQIGEIKDLFLFGQTRTKRKIISVSIDDSEKTQISMKNIQTRHHIPRPKVQKETIELMYEQAQEVFPINLHNTVTLPPFNLMLILLLKNDIFFLCGGIDAEFWNVNSQSFIYRLKTSDETATLKRGNESLPKLQSEIPTTKKDFQNLANKRRAFNKFERLPFMKEARYSHMGLQINYQNKNLVYVFGGQGSNKESLNTCEKYCFEKNEWENIAPMKVKRATGFCFQFLEKVYVFGGFTSENKRTKKIQVLHLDVQKWETLDVKLHQGIEQGFVTSCQPNEILVMGGCMEGGKIRSIVRVNLIQETYAWDSELIYADSLQKGTQLNGKVYIFGGEKPAVCQVYDPLYSSVVEVSVKDQTADGVKTDQLSLFSALQKTVQVPYQPQQGSKYSKATKISPNQFLIFGTDIYPFVAKTSEENQLSESPISMRIRLRKNMTICRINQFQYLLIGGIDSFENQASKACFHFHSKTRKVAEIGKLPVKLYKPGVCRTLDFLYLIGGSTKNQRGQQVQTTLCLRLCLKTLQWKKFGELNYARSECQVVEILAEDSDRTQLVIFGGYCDGEWVDKVEHFVENKQSKSVNSHQKLRVLNQLTPLLFPVYSIYAGLVLTEETRAHSGSKVKIFVMNRDIHNNSFQEVYLIIELGRSLDEWEVARNKRQQLDKYDSVDFTSNYKTVENKGLGGRANSKSLAALKNNKADRMELQADRRPETSQLKSGKEKGLLALLKRESPSKKSKDDGESSPKERTQKESPERSQTGAQHQPVTPEVIQVRSKAQNDDPKDVRLSDEQKDENADHQNKTAMNNWVEQKVEVDGQKENSLKVLKTEPFEYIEHRLPRGSQISKHQQDDLSSVSSPTKTKVLVTEVVKEYKIREPISGLDNKVIGNFNNWLVHRESWRGFSSLIEKQQNSHCYGTVRLISNNQVIQSQVMVEEKSQRGINRIRILVGHQQLKENQKLKHLPLSSLEHTYC